MRYDHDIIVVGAGNGGLAAACRAAGAGYDVAVLEKHNLAGGVASSFVRGRFEFEASLHELCDVGSEDDPGDVRKLFTELDSDARFINEKNLFRAIVTGRDGYDVTLSAGRENFRKSLLKVCPGCEKSLDRLASMLDRTSEALAYNDSKKGKPNKLVMMFKYGKFLISASHSLDDVLRSLGFNSRERSILETYWSYLGVPADELNAFHYFEMLKGYIRHGAGIPLLKSYGLSLSLCDSLLRRGGSIRYNCEVTEFIFDSQKKVIGVRAGGDEYYAKHVISNVIPHNVFGMSGKNNVPEKDRRLLNARKFGMSFICIYLGLDKSAEELGIKDYTVFISHRKTSRLQYDDEENMGFYVVNCLNLAVSEASPEGTCSLFITVPVTNGKLMRGVKPENYYKFKQRIAEKYVDDLCSVLGIDIRENIEEISVATPVTFARYFGSPDGTAYGYRLSGWDGLMARMLSKGTELDIEGLTFCGGHASSGDGFGVSYRSGVEAADEVISKLGGKNDG
ncbi:MAG: NAD(P)/FAD-dependent oxidoreductase [Clostridia bacterium]|nr:NAD(P)/FAD-dependent oxidoreductase [Clostridia bacterium]